MSTETIGPHAESGFGPVDVLEKAEQGDDIHLEMDFYDGPFETVDGVVENITETEQDDDRYTLKQIYVDSDSEGVDLVNIDVLSDRRSAYVTVQGDVELKYRDDRDWQSYEIDDLAMCELERGTDDLPEWLPEEYDLDAPLYERLPIMAEIEGGIELHVGDDRGIVEVVGEPHELTENYADTLTLKAGGHEFNWDFEIVVPKPENGDAFLRSVDPDQDYEDYIDTRTRELEDVDVRIYAVDHDRLEGAEVTA
ncbi:hypothetical protein [Halomontanus rarus]|uniref:hypothetical protein n=1 Tax=Halomontanus rarus TaxID=3034020 RepID=UPI0023E8AB32|nr:hypothetical protein [Halovivax sp. TS33]